MGEVDWFDFLTDLVERRIQQREKFGLWFQTMTGKFFLDGIYSTYRLSDEAYNAIAPLYTFNPFTEKYEGKFTLLQIWEYLL